MKSIILILIGYALGVGSVFLFQESPDMMTIDTAKSAQFEDLTRSLGEVVLSHPRAKGATWERKENGTFFVMVDIGDNENMELVFRAEGSALGMALKIIRARIITPKKSILCKYPFEVLRAMDNGTSFSEAECEEQSALKQFFST